MRGSDLNHQQLCRLKAALAPKLGYLRKLKARMLERQFPEHDRMLRDVAFAEQALHDLLMEIETCLSYRRGIETPEPFR